MSAPPVPVNSQLSPALRYLEQFPQFIVYFLTPSAERPGKLDKLPINLATRAKLEWTTPSNWMTYQEALAAASTAGSQYGVGFVITPETKLFCLDVDGALQKGVSCPGCFSDFVRQTLTDAGLTDSLNVPNGECSACGGNGIRQWHPLASNLRAMLPLAGFEFSVSYEGFHNWGRYEGPEPAHAKVKVVDGIKIELFTSGKWFALGDQSRAEGDAGADCTVELAKLIADYFTPQAGDAKLDWSEGHELGWELPNDEELVRTALSFKPSAQAAFSNGVSFADLWTRNAAKLRERFPSETAEFGESEADLALAGWLAWLTGNDCPRIESLMRKSFLSREKWDSHTTYLSEFTIPRALRQDRDFYDPKFKEKQQQEAERRREQIEENIRIGEGTEEYPPSSILTGDEMLARYVNIIEGKRVVDLDRPRRIFALDEWKSAHKSSRTVLEVEGEYKSDGTPKAKSHETTKLWEMHPARKQLDTVTFRPGHKAVTVDPEGKSAVNTWRPIERTPSTGDCSLFLQHVDYLFGADAPRFLDWLAHIEQKPGELPHHGWVHISPMHGTGRTWFSSVLCKLWVGHVAASFNLAGMLRTGYNGALSQKLLGIVDEINEGGSNARWDNAEALKTIVTEPFRLINPKYGHQRLEYNACRWLILSNHTSALPLTELDRRFNVIKNDLPPMPAEYYQRLYAALRDPGFIASVAWMLRTRDISTFNPGAHAMMNEAKRELVGASKSEADDIIADLIETHPADVITNSTLAGLMNNQPFGGGQLNPHQRHALDRAGTQAYGKPMKLAGKLVKVRILRNHHFWKTATHQQIQAELIKGTGAPPPVLVAPS